MSVHMYKSVKEQFERNNHDWLAACRRVYTNGGSVEAGGLRIERLPETEDEVASKEARQRVLENLRAVSVLNERGYLPEPTDFLDVWFRIPGGERQRSAREACAHYSGGAFKFLRELGVAKSPAYRVMLEYLPRTLHESTYWRPWVKRDESLGHLLNSGIVICWDELLWLAYVGKAREEYLADKLGNTAYTVIREYLDKGAPRGWFFKTPVKVHNAIHNLPDSQIPYMIMLLRHFAAHTNPGLRHSAVAIAERMRLTDVV